MLIENVSLHIGSVPIFFLDMAQYYRLSRNSASLSYDHKAKFYYNKGICVDRLAQWRLNIFITRIPESIIRILREL